MNYTASNFQNNTQEHLSEKTIFLLRHGETDWNREGRLQGHMDIPLNENGRLQISRTAQTLKKLCPDLSLIITSPLSRARESAEIAARHLAQNKTEILVEPLLTERFFGVGEGLTVSERNEKYPFDNYPGMEPLEDLIARGRAAFEQIISAAAGRKNVLVVAHGAILYALITALTDGRIPYGGKETVFTPGGIHLVKYSDQISELAVYDDKLRGFRDIWPQM